MVMMTEGQAQLSPNDKVRAGMGGVPVAGDAASGNNAAIAALAAAGAKPTDCANPQPTTDEAADQATDQATDEAAAAGQQTS